MIKIVIAEDHPIYRNGLREAISKMEGITIIGEAHNGFDLLELLHDLNPDLIILDLKMPIMDGLQVTKEIRSQPGNQKILILSYLVEKRSILQLWKLGIEGYVSKKIVQEELKEAITTIVSGNTYFTQEVSNIIFQNLKKVKNNKDKLKKLSDRELDILRLIVTGNSSQEVAFLLHISLYTVNTHRKNITTKLGIKNLASLTLFALKNGLIHTGSG